MRDLQAGEKRWRVMRLAVGSLTAVLVSVAIAHAATPSNDDYLSSTPVLTARFHDTVDTRDAGEQQGETLSCDGKAYGKTVWYDVLPPTTSGLRLVASGYDAVVAVYEYDRATGDIGRPVACRDAGKGTTEELDLRPPALEQGKAYTIQIGGAVVDGAARSGVLDVDLELYGDRDGDGVLDASDPCPAVAGTRNGCPPELSGTPRLAIAGRKLMLLEWAGLPRGADVRAVCHGCGRRGVSQSVRVAAGGLARFRAFAGVSSRRSAVLDVYATLPAAGPGPYRYGAIGKHARYRFGSGSFRWAMRCLAPGSTTQEMTCPR
jgi:hypothetical protein